jgi:DNA polymerase-4
MGGDCDLREASRRVMNTLQELTPLVEQISIDEAFLDVTDLPEAAEELARHLQRTINRQLNLPCSLGVATNKLVAKIATNVGKAAAQGDGPPNAIQVVPPGQEAAFLAPLGVRELWGVGPKTAAALAELKIHTIGDVAAWPEEDLARRFGKNGAELARRSRGVDERPIETEHETKSVSKEITFVRDVRDREILRRALHNMSQSVSRQLRHAGLRGSTVKIKLRWSDFTTLTRQVTLNGPTDQAIEIYRAALDLFEKTWPKGRPVRLLGVGVSGFEPQQRQMSLWEAEKAGPSEAEKLKTALDALRGKFGKEIVKRGSDLKGKDPFERE